MSYSVPGWRSHTSASQDKLIDTLIELGVDIEQILDTIADSAYDGGYEQGKLDTKNGMEE